MSRNFNLGSRDMTRAAENGLKAACERDELSFGSVATYTDRFRQFAVFCKAQGVNRMEHITQQHVVEFATTGAVANRSAAYRQNLVSAVNTVMSIATKGEWRSVAPVTDAGVEKRNNIREHAPSALDRAVADRAIAAAYDVSDRCGAMALLAREFGLRSEEAAKFNAHRALEHVRTHGCFTVEDGTKGGQPRPMGITNPEPQIAALEAAARAQGSSRSMIPAELSYSQFREGEMRAARDGIKAESGEGWHGLRAAYACARYAQLTGHPAPVVADCRLADKSADRAARLQIAEELGHHRIDVTVSYLGSAK